MAYTFEQSYYFRPYRGNSSFWLNRYGNGSIASHQKATLYTAAGSADQRLKVHKVSGGCQLLSDLNNAYGLNIYGRGAGSVCDFYPVSGNESDALIDLLTVDATNNLYRIKMINHNLYLTPASNSSGAALTWENASNADNQIWQLCASQSSGGTSTGDYVWPTKSTRITQSYSSGHTGIDIGAVTPGVEGDPIYAFCSGKVKRVFNWNASQGTSDNASMGNCVFIQSANPKPGNGGSYLRTIYMHMQSAPLVSVGQYVTKGKIIGYMGNTGNSSAAHLHFAMQANSTDMNPETGTDRYVDRDWINPMAYF